MGEMRIIIFINKYFSNVIWLYIICRLLFLHPFKNNNFRCVDGRPKKMLGGRLPAFSGVAPGDKKIYFIRSPPWEESPFGEGGVGGF